MNCTANTSSITMNTDSVRLKEMLPSCNLTGAELLLRKGQLQSGIISKIAKVEELKTGYDLIFYEPIEYSTELLEFINFERGCCSSFTYALIFEPNNKATHLQMYGSKDIKEEIGKGFRELGLIK